MAGARRRRASALAAGAALLAALAAAHGAAAQSPDPGDLPVDPQWLSNTLSRASTTTSVQNNDAEGAIASRDAALAAWKEAVAAGKRPDPLAKPEYLVVWSAKQNGGDVYGKEAGELAANATVNPQGLLDLLQPQFVPGLDGFQVIDERKLNVDGSENPDYGKVVNFVQLPLPWGVETEAHHMQYEWLDGQPIVAGGLYNDSTFILDASDIPNLKLKNIIAPQETPGGTIPDAYDAVGDGRFIGTYMGGPESNFGGSPGEAVVFKPDPEKGLVLESETPAGNVGGIGGGNAGGVPEPCSTREARPLGTCANPHGIQIRQDLHRLITADYAEPREIVLDPIKTADKYAFRPTVRTWDTADPAHPKLLSVSHMPNGPVEPAQRAHEQYGIMEDAKTWPDATRYRGGLESKGVFAGSMCGGGIFFASDVAQLKGDASKAWKQVWNDGLSEVLGGAPENEFLQEPGGCAGGAWHQVAPNNRLLFRSVQGRLPISDNYFDQGQAKLVYDVDISRLVRAAQSGNVLCDLSRGIHSGGYDLSGIELFKRLARGEQVADCPTLVSSVVVHDPTTGGPHWAALDNHSVDQNGVPYRLAFSDYFVSRTGVDGDHRLFTVEISPEGKLSYDRSFRDEKTGALGVDFNRRNWPGSPDAGFYKPHSEVWVCPPGICPTEPAISPRREAAAKPKAKAKARRHKKARHRTARRRNRRR
ncbi:MAG: hypothetical protein E6G10_21510 [Actinobacteria bacterium]|nr:MAG: hypothetical protein E6G10_21510 [Actinomycetota bacterium]